MTEFIRAPFVETKEYRRFCEFCDACRQYRYIGLCQGPAGVGKTLSARLYADWDRVEFAQSNFNGAALYRTDELPGNGCVFYTAPVVNTPLQISAAINSLREKLYKLVRQAIRTEWWPVIDRAQRFLAEERDAFDVELVWYAEQNERLQRAQTAVREA
jgi:hypothetical protein